MHVVGNEQGGKDDCLVHLEKYSSYKSLINPMKKNLIYLHVPIRINICTILVLPNRAVVLYFTYIQARYFIVAKHLLFISFVGLELVLTCSKGFKSLGAFY